MTTAKSMIRGMIFLLRITLGGARLDLRLGLADRSQAVFAPRQFFWNAQTLGQRLDLFEKALTKAHSESWSGCSFAAI